MNDWNHRSKINNVQHRRAKSLACQSRHLVTQAWVSCWNGWVQHDFYRIQNLKVLFLYTWILKKLHSTWLHGTWLHEMHQQKCEVLCSTDLSGQKKQLNNFNFGIASFVFFHSWNESLLFCRTSVSLVSPTQHHNFFKNSRPRMMKGTFMSNGP